MKAICDDRCPYEVDRLHARCVLDADGHKTHQGSAGPHWLRWASTSPQPAGKRGFVRLEHWFPIGRRLVGRVYNHPAHDDGDHVTTSPIETVRGEFIMTRSGTIYLLGTPDRSYADHVVFDLNDLPKEPLW